MKTRSDIEDSHHDARSLPLDADADLVTFRNVWDVSKIIASRMPDAQEACQFAACKLLQRWMGKHKGTAIKYTRLEYLRSLGSIRDGGSHVFAMQEAASESDASREYRIREFEEWLLAAVPRLTKRQASVVLALFRGATIPELARKDGVTETAIRATRATAISRLRDVAKSTLAA